MKVARKLKKQLNSAACLSSVYLKLELFSSFFPTFPHGIWAEPPTAGQQHSGDAEGWLSYRFLLDATWSHHTLTGENILCSVSAVFLYSRTHTYTHTHLHPENFFLVDFQLLGWDKSFLIYFLILLTDHICVLFLSSHLLSLAIVREERHRSRL